MSECFFLCPNPTGLKCSRQEAWAGQSRCTPFSRIEPLVVLQETAMLLLCAWSKVLCRNKGSWKTPSIQCLSVVTGESCCFSVTLAGGEDEPGAAGWHRSMQEEYSVGLSEVAVWANDQMRGLLSRVWWSCWKQSLVFPLGMSSQSRVLAVFTQLLGKSASLSSVVLMDGSFKASPSSEGNFKEVSLRCSGNAFTCALTWNWCFTSHSELSDSMASKSSRSLSWSSLSSRLRLSGKRTRNI